MDRIAWAVTVVVLALALVGEWVGMAAVSPCCMNLLAVVSCQDGKGWTAGRPVYCTGWMEVQPACYRGRMEEVRLVCYRGRMEEVRLVCCTNVTVLRCAEPMSWPLLVAALAVR